jgi:glycine cleavage system aminomethyltransferase T
MIGTVTLVRTPRTTIVDISNPYAARSVTGLATSATDTARMRLRGPQAAAVLRAAGVPAAHEGVVAGTGGDRFVLYCAVGVARSTWDALVAAGAVPVGAVALETVRIEDAEPCLERDFQQPLPPNAAGFGDATGAEPPARRLVAIEHEGLAPLPRAQVRIGETEVGDVRVACTSFVRAGRPIALASIDTARAVPGTAIEVGKARTWSPGVVTAVAVLPAGALAPNY